MKLNMSATDPLESIVPWGRSLSEYCHMFSLTERDLAGPILGCGDGPASFNAEGTQAGYRIVSIDPIYEYNPADILKRVREVHDGLVASARANKDQFIWDRIKSPEEMGARRLNSAEMFADDFVHGIIEGRYVACSVPHLPFTDEMFDLALSSHFLFSYAHLLDEEFHLAALLDLLRVAREVRCYPLMKIGGEMCPFVDSIASRLRTKGFLTSRVPVDYQFQKGATEMLRIARA